MIELDHICFFFGRTQILKDISFKIPKGSIFGLLGSNGAGKSTLIKIILGVLKPDSGSILFNKSHITEFNLRQMLKKTGSLIEQSSSYDFLTPLENLELARRIYGTEKGYSEELLITVGLASSAKQKVKTFSLGMKQRLGIALAMIGRPDFVILDEPTNGLDPIGILEFGRLISELNIKKGTTFLISSHNLAELQKIVTHFAIINNGTTTYNSSLSEAGGEVEKKFFEITKK